MLCLVAGQEVPAPVGLLAAVLGDEVHLLGVGQPGLLLRVEADGDDVELAPAGHGGGHVPAGVEHPGQHLATEHRAPVVGEDQDGRLAVDARPERRVVAVLVGKGQVQRDLVPELLVEPDVRVRPVLVLGPAGGEPLGRGLPASNSAQMPARSGRPRRLVKRFDIGPLPFTPLVFRDGLVTAFSVPGLSRSPSSRGPSPAPSPSGRPSWARPRPLSSGASAGSGPGGGRCRRWTPSDGPSWRPRPAAGPLAGRQGLGPVGVLRVAGQLDRLVHRDAPDRPGLRVGGPLGRGRHVLRPQVVGVTTAAGSPSASAGW